MPSLSAVPTHFSQDVQSSEFLTYTLLDADFQLSILHHVDAVVGLPGTEDVLALVQLHKEHVFAQLQEQGLLKVPQDPAAKKMQRENLKSSQQPLGNLSYISKASGVKGGGSSEWLQGRSLKELPKIR